MKTSGSSTPIIDADNDIFFLLLFADEGFSES